ncbi:MAG: ADP-L-glycero-D-manno-heptose 6-epimerase [Verrucomicrobiales bacterium]|jgi:ADP-L-glycero-D-manno-heptose 6-epimerase
MSLFSEGTILVTGGAGFIGSALIWELNRRGHDNIVISDRLGRDEKWKNLTGLRYQDYVDADVLIDAVEASEDCLGDVTSIFHLGACSATTETDADFLIANNYEYTKAMALWSQSIDARFVYASSAATYGDGEQGMSDTGDIDGLRPLNMYGYSKHLFDLWAQKQEILDDMVGLKYFNVYGPNENHKDDMRSLVNKAYAQIVETGKVGLFKSYKPDYKDGKQMRDFLYVKDAVKMTLHLAENPDANGLFNIGSGNASTWIQLVDAIFAALEKEPQIEFIEMPETMRDKYQYYTCADTGKLDGSGYEGGTTGLADAVRDYVANYLVPGKLLDGGE